MANQFPAKFGVTGQTTGETTGQGNKKRLEKSGCQSVFTVGLRHESKGVYTGKDGSHKTIFGNLAKSERKGFTPSENLF